MKKHIRDYIHLYIGCNVSPLKMALNSDFVRLTAIDLFEETCKIQYVNMAPEEFVDREEWISINKCKLFLNPIDKITQKIGEQIVVITNRIYKGSEITKILFESRNNEGMRFIVSYKDWADEIKGFTYQGVKHYEVIKLLLDNHYDLFDLIKSGCAIEKP